MKIIRCDRCEVDDDPFPRELTLHSIYKINPSPSMPPAPEPDHMVLHLCGYCTVEFKRFLKVER